MTCHPDLAATEYQRSMGFGAGLRHSFRFASRPIGDLLRLGSVVRTNYGTGPYVVVEIERCEYRPPEGGWYPHYQLTLQPISSDGEIVWASRACSWIGEIVPCGRRLLALFAANDDEVIVTGFRADAAHRLRAAPSEPLQLDLFAGAA